MESQINTKLLSYLTDRLSSSSSNPVSFICPVLCGAGGLHIPILVSESRGSTRDGLWGLRCSRSKNWGGNCHSRNSFSPPVSGRPGCVHPLLRERERGEIVRRTLQTCNSHQLAVLQHLAQEQQGQTALLLPALPSLPSQPATVENIITPSRKNNSCARSIKNAHSCCLSKILL